ncbi:MULTISPECIES: hypothetical protein [unclassified Kitasatospora]|nr:MULTISPECIES: hypothetical protein [unclassified Kitasatospora]
MAFTAGLGATAASATAAGGVADRSAVQLTVTASGFDWDSPRPAPPAQS